MSGFADPVQLVLIVWGAPGVIVAVAFLAFGIDRIDGAASGAYAFRPLLLPGLIILWPLVIWRWAVLAKNQGE
jgi:hypothetical protein